MELGLVAKDDPRRGATLGAYSALKSVDPKGKRSSASSAFYFPNASRPNLTVLTSAHVEKIISDDKKINGEAVVTGVLVSVLGLEYVVPVIGEVILSAGTFLSPKILELSGIGSKTILQANDIPVVVENSHVGENLQVCILSHGKLGES
jgi:choline dehydrogenase-like flavoprotein